MLLLLIHACLPGALTGARAQGGSHSDTVQFPSVSVEFVAGPQLGDGAEDVAVWFDANALLRGVMHGAAFPSDPAGVDLDEYLNYNYYDQALVQYINFYRSGDPKYLGYARKIADSWWRVHHINEGRREPEASMAPRSVSLGGLMLRALDGRPEMWPWITRYIREHYFIWVERPTNWSRALTDDQLAGRAPRQEGGQTVTKPAGFYFGVRDGGYMLLYAANLARIHPDPAVRAEFRQKVLDGAVNYYARLQALQPPADGGFYYELDPTGVDFPAGLTTQPFQEGILGEGLIQVHRLTGDERVKQSIVKLAEHLYLRAYNPSGWKAMYYFVGGRFADGVSCETGCGQASAPWPDPNPAATVPEARQLNPTTIHVFGYAYLLTGDPKFKAWGDEIFDATFSGADGYRGLCAFRAKEYAECQRSSGRYLAWRAGGALPVPTPMPTTSPAPTPAPPPTPARPPSGEGLLGGRILSDSTPVAGHRVFIYDAHGDAIGATRTDARGRFTFPVNFGQRGIIRPAGRGAFTPSEYSFTASGNRNDLDFVAAPNQIPGDATIRLKASSVSKTQINLDWSDNSSSRANFRLERCLGAGCMDFKLIAVFSPNLTSYGNAGLTANTTYRYRVRPTSGVGSSLYSNTVQVTTRP